MSRAQELIDEHTECICDHRYTYKSAVIWGAIKSDSLAVLEALAAAGVYLYTIYSSTKPSISIVVNGVTNIRKTGASIVYALESLGYPIEAWTTTDSPRARELECKPADKLELLVELYPDGNKCKFKVVATKEEIVQRDVYELDCPEDNAEEEATL